MSQTVVFSHREAVPVTVGSTVVFCESFKASAVRAINEETTVNGASIITSSGIRAMKLVFSGRIYDETAPLGFLADINGEMNGNSYTVVYRGLIFTDCIIQKYEVTDSGQDWIDVSFTLVTSDAVTEDTE